ncbi:MAG: DUF456 domain-containing protein [Patescibacteria group bacterium]|jgi:hypothetical protein
MDYSQIFIVIACGVVMVVGLCGVVLPFFPGMVLMWTAFSLYAGITQFQVIGYNHVFLVSLLVIASLALEYLSRFWGGHRYNTSKWGLIGAIIGGMIGSLFGWFMALLIGPFVGAVIGEVYAGRDGVFKITFRNYSLIGFVGGTIVKITIGVAIIGIYVHSLIEYY